MEFEMVELNLAITLLEGWLQLELTVGKFDSPQNALPSFCAGFSQESWVQRSVTRLDLVMS